MRIVNRMAAQGDVIFMRVSSLPENLEEVPVDDGKGFVVAHSETGHHHVAVGADSFLKANDFQSYLVATGPIEVTHERSFDTHEPLQLLGEGNQEVIWEVRRQREWVPEGYRRVED